MFIQYIQMAIMPLIMIAEQFGELQRAFGAADRIFTILDTKSELGDGDKDSVSFNESISFDDVSFSYDGKKQVLKDISFTIKKGETLAIVGSTGSGKTTIISLLTRFYDPQKGSILVDGEDIRNYNRKSLRAKMSLVLQEIFLFPGTLRDNLRVLRQDIDDKRVEDAAQIIGLDEFTGRFPDGYDTVLSEDGGNLSFGERQLISFTRALVFDPEILIMDEATSSVDPYTESLIQKSMGSCFRAGLPL
jgi:ATP-binding cassette subfamily B protein